MPNGLVSVSTSVSGVSFDLLRMSGTESLGQLFEFQVDLLCDDDHVGLDAFLGQTMSIELALQDGTSRYFHGYITRFSHAGLQGRRSRYSATIRPWLWFLTRRSDCRIFQEQTAQEIIKDIFRERGYSDIEDSLYGTFRTRDYCVQYRETDFDFVSRLMQEEGIYYYFRHEATKHTLVLADGISSHSSVSGYETVPYRVEDSASNRDRDAFFDWSVSQDVRSSGFAQTDYDFENPSADLTTLRSGSATSSNGELKIFEYPGGYTVTSDGETYAAVRLGELESLQELSQGEGNARGLGAGVIFSLADFPRSDQNREYLIESCQQVIQLTESPSGGSTGDVRYRGVVKALPSNKTFRPFRETPKPIMRGPQTALVVGKQGEEIWTDSYGRIKVQFFWDRYGQKDENSSCWVRVAQVWAGKTWGGMAIPRIGQEVIVDFLDGDPDRPIVTGRVYNAEQMPPYALPDNATQTGLKSRSSKSGDAETFNELRFEDKKDEEQIYFHAEKNFDRIVENNDTLKVGFDKKDKGDQTIEIFNNQTITVGTDECDDGSQTITVYKDRAATIKTGDESLTVEQGNRTVTVDQGNDTHQVKEGNRAVTVDQGNDETTVSQGNQTITVSQGNQTINVTAGSCTIEAGQAIELKVGGCSIKIDASGITLKGMQVSVQGESKTEIKGAMTQVSGDGVLQMKGGVVQIN